MGETFFIGDTHFGHANILKFEAEARPFETLEQMHEALIVGWNSVVGKNDKVFHLGDFCFGKKYLEIAGELNGLKYLILGNHDTYASQDYLRYFHKLSGAKYFHDLILTHIPVHPYQLEHRFKANVHGHAHSGTFDMQGKIYVNVCCEKLPNLAPINYEEVRQMINNEERKLSIL